MKTWSDVLGIVKHPVTFFASMTAAWSVIVQNAQALNDTPFGEVVTVVLAVGTLLVGANTASQRERGG